MRLMSPREMLALGFVAHLHEMRLTSGAAIKASREFALQAGAPLRYLETSLQRLARAGILSSARGPLGGYRLAKSGDEITVGDVLRALADDDDDLVHPAMCGLTRNRVKPALTAMAELFLKEMDACTIAAFVTMMPLAEVA